MKKLKRWLVGHMWRESWNVAVVAASPSSVLAGEALESPCWLFPDAPSVYHADPFLLEESGRRYLFCERFDWGTCRGNIVVGELLKYNQNWRIEGVRPLRVGEGGHTSYPHIVRHDGEVFMVPETADRGRVELWRARRLPDDWVCETTILSDFPGIDSTVLRTGDRFWLFTGRSDGHENQELYVFQAPTLTGPWKAVNSGPVIRNSGTARMAGDIFMVGGKLIRPAQDCRGSYGRRIVLREIEVLETNRYQEKTVGIIDPAFAHPYDQGIHTLNFADGVGVIDGKRYLGPRRHIGPLYAATKRRFAVR